MLLFHFIIENLEQASRSKLSAASSGETSFTLLSSPWGHLLAPNLGTGLWVPNTTQQTGVQERARTPELQSPVPAPAAPASRALRLALAVCSPSSSGASRIMNYESSLGVPTRAYGSAEPQCWRHNQGFPSLVSLSI